MCVGPESSSCTLSIEQIIFYLWSLEVNVKILRISKLVLCLESYTRQHYAFWLTYELKSLSYRLLRDWIKHEDNMSVYFTPP